MLLQDIVREILKKPNNNFKKMFVFSEFVDVTHFLLLNVSGASVKSLIAKEK